MASKMRVEFLRLREKNSNGLQNLMDANGSASAAPVTRAVSITALTGAGRVTCPALIGGYTSYHVRISCDVDIVVTFAPSGDAGTTYDASLTEEGGILIAANKPELIPVTPGLLISAVTAPYA